MQNETQQLQNELIQLKAKAFDLQVALETAQQMLDKVGNAIAAKAAEDSIKSLEDVIAWVEAQPTQPEE